MSIQIEKKFFADPQGRGLNADDDYFAIESYQIINGENIRTGTTDAGVTATVESIGSNVLKSEFQPSITYVTIGTAEDTENRRTINFKCCITGPWHRIEAYSSADDTIYIVVFSSQVIDGLNFSKNDLIHSARVINGLLYWTDNLNRQRKINIDKGIKLNQPSYIADAEAYTAPISQEVISLLKRPPLYPLGVTKVTQPSKINNFVKTFSGEFTYAYYYKDGETSVLATYSILANYNASVDTYNRIDLLFPIGEFIDQDVQRIDLIIRDGNTNNYTRIFSWDKSNPAQAAEIISHNAGITVLSYTFYNDKGGDALDPAYAIKPFDSVPIRSRTLEIARDRLFLGNNLIGYDTPQVTFSLDGVFITQEEGGTVTGQWWELVATMSGPSNYYYVVYIGSIGVYSGYYGMLPYPGPTFFPTLPTIVDYPTELVFISTNLSAILHYFSITPEHFVSFSQSSASTEVTNPPATTSLIGTSVFKSDAPYQFGLVFYDFGDRKCGVITNNNLIFTTPDREYDSISFTTSFNWTLNNNNALSEIPDWATHYSIVITKCLRTRFFEQSRVKNITYVTKDVDGIYLYNTAAYAANLNGVGIDITLLNGYGMGYIFTEGDFVKVWLDGFPTPYTMSVIAQDGNWIICELLDLGTIGDTGTPKVDALFELFTPYKPTVSEPFFECGQTYPILSPGTSSRVYSILNGSIGGDVTILNRGDGVGSYLTENMSPNDKFYKVWNTNTGRPNFVTIIGQALQTHTIAYSNTYIAGSRVNGLSSFEALNTKPMPLECGDIWKLQVTSKVQDEQGIVMLCICTNETASLYIGETQQYGSNAETTLTIFTDVIGTINVLKGSFGTINAESVVEYRGMVFWYDAINGRIIQYSVNGLFPVSDYKMRRYWKQFSNQYLSMTTEQIENLGSRPFVFGGVDPYHNEVLFTVPKLLDNPPKGYLPDYPETIFPFDIWDGQAKTNVFKLMAEGSPFWFAPFTWTPDYFATIESNLLSYKQGQTYLHNSITSFNNFYGQQYRSKIMFVLNQIPDKPKVYNAMSVQSNFSPEFVYFYSGYPVQQSSDLVDFSYQDLEGIWYSVILRNKLIPTSDGYTTDGLLTGDKMRNVALLCMTQWLSEAKQLELKFISVSFSQSRGHVKV